MAEPSEATPEDQLLWWEAATAGDRESLEALLRSFQDQIFRFCLVQLRGEHQAVEATQETALRLIENLASYTGRSKITSWVLGIANNVCREQRRKSKKWRNDSDSSLEKTTIHPLPPTQSLIDSEEKSRLNQAIDGLPNRQREALVLRYFESLSIADVAQVMDVSVGTVKATLNQALKKLKIELIEKFE